MKHTTETHTKTENINNNNANDTSHYKLIVIGLIMGLVGVFLRFVGTWTGIDAVSNVLFAIGSVVCIKSVLDILK